jgi:predicted NAD/FAD-binding protein
MTLGEFLDLHGYSPAFREDHLLPMAGAIWSMPAEQILAFPARSFGDFFRNHGLLELDVSKRPEWRTVSGGSRSYVDRLVSDSGATIVTEAVINHVTGTAKGAQVHFADGTIQSFDHVVIATHADEALALLPDATGTIRDALRAFRYSANETYLHSDATLMPCRKRLWASWNYMQQSGADQTKIFVSYWMNRLQKLPIETEIFVTLNPPKPPAQDKVYAHQVYHHPQFDTAAIAAQLQLRTVQGKDHIWLCGSYCGYGFHEDALASGLAVANALGSPRAWTVVDKSPAFQNATPA